MYRMWLDEEEYDKIKMKMYVKIIRIDKDGAIFVECGSLDDWKFLNALLVV